MPEADPLDPMPDVMPPSGDGRPRFLLTTRVADEDPVDGAHALLNATWPHEPSDDEIADHEEGAIEAFRRSFGRDPARVGTAVLPYLHSVDGAGDD